MFVSHLHGRCSAQSLKSARLHAFVAVVAAGCCAVATALAPLATAYAAETAPAAAPVAAPAAAPVVVAAAAEEKWPMRFDLALGLGFGYLSPNNFMGNGGDLEDRPASAGLFGLRGTAWILDKLGVELESNILPTSFRNGRGGSATVFGERLGVIYSFMPEENFRPFLTAGGGMEIFKAGKTATALAQTYTYALASDQDWVGSLGAGFQWQFLHRLGLRVDARWVPMRGKDQAAKTGPTIGKADNVLASNVEGLLSLAYTFGGKPGDADGDGILDGIDKCEDQAEDKDGFQDDDGCPDNDNDNDGIADAEDKCPNEAEDKDGYMDYDGCPELDNDGDGVLDTDDKCPTEKEDKDGFQDQDGCPDPDNDNDGLLDAQDKCPKEAEDKDGFQDDDGCPDPDNDKDGILDTKDKCPNQPETKNGYQDDDGCPDEIPDTDKDGIPDAQDKCPDKPETKNGYQDDDGCPDEIPAALKKFTGAIAGIEFETGSAKITKKTFKVLDAAVKVLVEFKDTRIEISGHTDNVGEAEANKKLSLERAESVKAYFIEKTVAASRIEAVGHGQDKPVADNKTKKGQAKNRRIEFKLL